MASVRDMISAVSGSSSFDTWSRSRDEDETSGGIHQYPVRYVREGEFDTDYDPVEVRRHAAEQDDLENRTSLFPMQSPPMGSRIRSFFQAYDDGTVLSASLSRSPTEYTKGTSSVTDHSRSSTAEQTPISRDTSSRTRSIPSIAPSPSSGRRSVQSRGGGGSLRVPSPGRWSIGSSEFPHDEEPMPALDSLAGILDTSFETNDSSHLALPPTARRPILEEIPSTILEEQLSMENSESPSKNRTAGRSPGYGILPSSPSRSAVRLQYSAGPVEDIYSTIEGSPARLDRSCDTSSSSPSKQRSAGSRNTQASGSMRSSPALSKENRTRMDDSQMTKEEELILLSLQEMSKKRSDMQFSSLAENEVIPSSYESPEGLTDPVLDESRASERSAQIALHDLCSEAQSPNDITWRNALYMLSIKPQLANVSDSGWTPLHITCLKDPPEFMVRAILVAAPEAAGVIDNSGRLPLHLVASTSANPDILQVLVDEYPQALAEFDDKGMLPLHRILRNEEVELTIRHLRILLGQTIKQTSGKKGRVSRRRGEHLDLSFEQVNELTVNEERDEKHARDSYPEDIQVSFTRLSLWKRKRNKLNRGEREGLEVSLDNADTEGLNPASLPTSDSSQLALHLAVLRRTVGPRRNSEDSEREEDDLHERASMAANSAEILRVLIAAHPDALTTRDGGGRTPLLLALCGKDSLPNQDMVELLLGRGAIGFESPPQWAGDVELHKTHDNRYTNPAMIATKNTHQLPLHVAAEQMTSNVSVLASVYEAYPGAIQVQDIRGRTPLHLAMSNFEMVQVDPKVLTLMLTDRVAQTKDDEGRIPFDLFLKRAHQLPLFEPEQRFDEPSPASVYKHFFQTSIVPQSSTSRAESSHFLQRLRKLPPWMRRYAVSAGFVQDMLQEETVQASCVFLILLNGAVLGSLLLLFRLDMDTYSQTLQDASYSTVVYVLSSALIVFHVLLSYACIEMSVFMNQCFCNLLFWVDMIGPSLAFSTALLRNDWSSETVAAMGTAATGFLWMGVVGYFARYWRGMAVFIGGIGRLVRLLFWPLVALTALVVGFAQMFFTLSTTSSVEDCDTALGGRALCTVRDSYTTVYLLLLGTPVVDTGDNDNGELTNGSITLITTFTFLLAIFIMNVVVSVVIEASRADWEEAAAVSFWESKLLYIYLTHDLTQCFPSFASGGKLSARTGRMRGACNLFSSLGPWWTVCMISIFGRKQDSSGSFSTTRPTRSSNTMRTACHRMMSLMVVPIWWCLGAATLGILWPPQVRSWLFGGAREGNDNKSKLDYSAHQFSAIRNDLLQLKTMSYEKSKSTEEHVAELRRLILDAVRQG